MFTPDDLANVERLFKVVANRTRLAALLALEQRPQCVHSLVATLGLPQPLVSQHLRVLREAGLVRATRNGKEVEYAIADGHVSHLVSDALDHVREGRSP